MYWCTSGSPSSCLLFIIFIHEMIKMFKSVINHNGFIGMLRVLLLMDDTIPLATSKDKCEAKLVKNRFQI